MQLVDDAKMKYVRGPNGCFSTALLEDDDFAHVKVIYRATFARHNDADFAESWHRRNRQSSMGLFYKATLIGFGITVLEKFGEQRLAFLAVDAAHRGSGAGSQLLTALLATLDYCYLVPVNNLKVIDWYYSHGFIRCDADRTYAPDEAHFIMTYVTSPATIAFPSPTISRESSGISVLAI